MESRFHSPYKHWVLGLATEVVMLTLFLVAMCLIGVVVALVR